MDIISEKRYKQIPVIDYDIMYLGGLHDQICIHPADRAEITPEFLRFWIMNEKTGDVAEFMECERRNMLSYKRRDRFLKVEDTSPLPE